MGADAGTVITAGAIGVLALVAGRYFMASGVGRPSPASLVFVGWLVMVVALAVGLLEWVVGDAEGS